jgi:hypothetical protein
MRQFSSANPDFEEGVASYKERRVPRFEPLPTGYRLPAPLDFAPQSGLSEQP